MKPNRWGLIAAFALVGVLILLVARSFRPAPGEWPAVEPGPAGAVFGSAPGVGSPGVPPPLPSGPAIRGIVVDGEGTPLEGAELAAARAGEKVPVRVITGGDGRFALPVGSADEEYLLGARAPGMAPVLAGGVRPGREDRRVVLRPGARLLGRVKDPAGMPCAGARVRATLRFPGVAQDLGGFETRADESGRYAFEGFPAVEGSVQATFHESSSEPVPFIIHPGEGAVETDLRVETGPSLEGIVRDADGTPLPGISVSAENVVKGGARSALTGADGRFVLRGLDPVLHEVAATDLQALRLDTAPRRATPPDRGIEITMAPNPEPPAYATFRVVDAAGNEVRAVRTLQFRGGQPGPTGSGSLAADGSGLFRTGRLRRERYRIDLRCPSGTGTTGEFAVEHGRTVDLGTIRLAPGAAVRGRIVDAAGAPAPTARVFAGDDTFPEPGAVAADGTFSLKGLSAGPGRLRILHPGCAELVAPWQAAAGETAELGDLRLRPATGAFRGSVRSRSGAAVAGARIRISPWDDFGPGSDARRMLAGADGRFEASALAAGRWVLSAAPPRTDADQPGGVAKEESFTSDAKAKRLDLGEGEQVEVVLEID